VHLSIVLDLFQCKKTVNKRNFNNLLALTVTYDARTCVTCGLSLKTGPARLGHVKIVIDVTAVDVDLFFFTLPVQ